MAHEFIRRFLLHVLSDGFMRVRHFGFLANRSKKQALAQCRRLLKIDPAVRQLLPNLSGSLFQGDSCHCSGSAFYKPPLISIAYMKAHLQ